GEYGGLPQRQVVHVRAEPDPLGAGGDEAEQRPRVVEPRLVGVVLERGEVEPGPVGDDREVDDAVRRVVDRSDEDPEEWIVPVVRHADLRPSVAWTRPTLAPLDRTAP